jgi:hypothetical protein
MSRNIIFQLKGYHFYQKKKLQNSDGKKFLFNLFNNLFIYFSLNVIYVFQKIIFY